MTNLPSMARAFALVWIVSLALPHGFAAPVINEIFHRGPKDRPIQFVEIHNPGSNAVDVSGWQLRGSVRFTFTNQTAIGPGGFCLVARDPAAFLKQFGTNATGPFEGRLGRRNGRVELRDRAGSEISAVGYALGFPWPAPKPDDDDHSLELIHPSLDPRVAAHWKVATITPKRGNERAPWVASPGRQNHSFNPRLPTPLFRVDQTPRAPAPNQPVTILARFAALATQSPTSVSLEYQIVDPGNYIPGTDPRFAQGWIPVPMARTNATTAGELWFVATLPQDLQQHRRLVRYRVRSATETGLASLHPSATDSQPNFAYFVHGGVPAWRGAIQPGGRRGPESVPTEFPAEVMASLPTYHLIARREHVERAQWHPSGDENTTWPGTLVYRGEVYDHVRFRARGGGWRHAMGKNMWKIVFNRGYELQAHDNQGRPYPERWSKLNLGACIQQADYGHRGEQGMFESVGFRLFNLAGVEAPDTHWLQLRVIDSPREYESQYRGDFWGLYLAVEQMDGAFLEAHQLPDGNLYKMEFGSGELNNHGAGQPSNRADLDLFLQSYTTRPRPESWWRTHLDLGRYYSYRSIVECIHHYDIDEGAGKNYFYFNNPVTRTWSVHPWDIDLTWNESMFGGGESPFAHRVLPQPNLGIEYRNRLREIRDLLFNTQEMNRLIDEHAAIIARPKDSPSMVMADRALWDHHPVMTDGRSMGGKSGPGLFYRAAATKDFEGMVALMKAYVARRSAWIDQTLLRDPSIPATPVISTQTAAGKPRFTVTPYSGKAPFAAIQWRIGEVADPTPAGSASPPTQRTPGRYEIQPLWTSPEITRPDWEMQLPDGLLRPGGQYRLRARFKDSTGRWSHWSSPVNPSP